MDNAAQAVAAARLRSVLRWMPPSSGFPASC